MPGSLAAVVVDHDTGPLLSACVRSLWDEGVDRVVVVENGAPGSARSALETGEGERPGADVVLVRPERNLGFGAGVNRGLAAVAGLEPAPEWVLVSNTDLVVHPGALDALRRVLEERPSWALVGPRIYTEQGEVYPSVRQFPSFVDAAGHALFALFRPENRFSRRYNPGTPEGEGVQAAGWISGSCFLARRRALEELGGFDEAYFMYAEDMDLCWRAHQAGWGVGFSGAASVTHIQGVSTARHPYKMMLAHHRSALRFTVRTTSGWRRAALPLAVVVLGFRLVLATARLALYALIGMGRSPVRGILVVAAAALLLGACTSGPSPKKPAAIHVQPLVNFALPPAGAGCGGVTALAGGAQRLPITVSTVAGQVEELVNVCIGGKGPYPFVIDSGAGESIIDAHLAARLHLADDGATSEFEGVGCTGTAQPVSVPAWSAAGATLDPQTLVAATLPDFGTPGQPVGLLGSDVLSRFGAVRIDFVAKTLTLGGPQGPPLAAGTVRGPTGPAPSALLTQGEQGTTVPLTVILTPGDISLDVKLRLGHGPARNFAVDTGSSQSVVGTAVAKADHLAHTDQAQRQTTVCSTITAPLDKSGPWSIPGVTLHPQDLGVTPFGPISAGGIDGLLGSDQLKRFGWLIFDYTGGRLVLG